MAYQALYRKWRPMVFDDVVGQDHITTTLKNEILNNKLSHAYLFTGTRGTGKTSTAKIFSRAVNCLNPKGGNPCNECEICKGILSERILDVIEIDAASNTGVDNIRDIIEQTKYATFESKYHVYIIDEVHMLSQGAFNALLKTLEEPTENVVFILATTEIHKVPATIMSRCQRFDFKTINITDIVNRIKYILGEEGIRAEEEALQYVAKLGDGSMRDSLSILDQCLAFKENDLTYSDVVETIGAIDNTFLYEIAEKISKQDAAGAVEIFENCIAQGKNTDYFADALLEVFRSTLLYKISGNIMYAELKSENTKRIAEKYTVEKLMYCVNVLTKLLSDIKYSSSAKVYIEMAIIKMATPCLDDSNEAILARISQMEQDLKKGVKPVFTQEDLPPFETDDFSDIPLDEPTAVYDPEESVVEIEPELSNNVPPVVSEDEGLSDGKAMTVCKNWSEVENAIMNEGSLGLYMAVRGARPTPFGDVLHLVFEDAESRDRCATKENKAMIEQHILNLFGFDVSTEYYTKNQVPKKEKLPEGDFFGKIEQFSREFPENIEIDEN